MESHTQDAQRIEDTAESRPLVESSNVPRESSVPPETIHGTREQAQWSRSKKFKELRQLGAVDFYGIVDLAETETWLKRTERVFRMMRCTREEQFDFAVSLLQGDAYDWWETVPDSMAQPPLLNYEDFLREFRDRYMPEVYRDEK